MIKYRERHSNFVRCIYEAGDLNEDGYLEYKEYELLTRYLSRKDFP